MKNQFTKYNYFQNRREFIINAGKTGIGIFVSGITLNALAYEKPTKEQIKNFVFGKFQNIRERELVPRLIEDVKLAKLPFDYGFTKNIIGRDYGLRSHISYTLSDLTEQQLMGILEGNEARRLYLWEPHQLQYKDNINLVNTIISNELPIVQKLSEIKPIDSIEVSIDKQMKGSTYCREVIIQIIFEAVTGVKIAKDKIAEFSSDFIDIIDCIVKALKQENWNQLEFCIAKRLVPLILSGKFLKILKKVLGAKAFKKFLIFTTTRFVPIIGIAFFVFQLILAMKSNWENFKDICLN